MIGFLFLHENLSCKYSLEVPQQGISTHNMFFEEIRKIYTFQPEKKSYLAMRTQTENY